MARGPALKLVLVDVTELGVDLLAVLGLLEVLTTGLELAVLETGLVLVV